MQPTFCGIPVFSSPLAEQVVYHWEVQKHPTKKRRRNWKPVRVEERKPCAYQTPMGIFMHPTLYAKLREHSESYQFRSLSPAI